MRKEAITTKRKTCITVAMTMMALSPVGCTAKNTGNKAPAATQEATITEDGTDTQVSEAAQGAVVADQTGADIVANTATTFADGLGSQVSVEPTGHATILSGSPARAWMLADGQLDAVTEDICSGRNVEIPDTAINLEMLKSPNVEALIGSDATFATLSTNIEEHITLHGTLEKIGITTTYFDVEIFENCLDMMKICTDITGWVDSYKEQGAGLEAQIKEQIARADGSHPTVLLLRAFPTRVKAKGSDNVTGQMLKDLGCVNAADSNKALLDNLSTESIVVQGPDYIFMIAIGGSDEAVMKSVEDMLLSSPAWKELSAVKDSRCHVLPKALFHNKPSSRWGENYQMLADILHRENRSESD